MKKVFLILVVPLCILLFVEYKQQYFAKSILNAGATALRMQGYIVDISQANKAYPDILEKENAVFLLEKAFENIGDLSLDEVPLFSKKDLPRLDAPLTKSTKKLIEEYLSKKIVLKKYLFDATKMEKYRSLVDLKKGYDAKLLHLSKMRRCLEVLLLQVFLEIENKNTSQAVNIIGSCVQLSNFLINEPISIINDDACFHGKKNILHVPKITYAFKIV